MDTCNLWLIDERLAFHEYLASDKQLKTIPITGSESTKRPDICSLRVFDQPVLVSEDVHPPFASLDIVEIKRPMRGDAAAGEESDPVEQAIGYLRRIRDGGLVTRYGRPIPANQDVPGFCYVLADLTAALHRRCRDHHDLRQTPRWSGLFWIQSQFEGVCRGDLLRSSRENRKGEAPGILRQAGSSGELRREDMPVVDYEKGCSTPIRHSNCGRRQLGVLA